MKVPLYVWKPIEELSRGVIVAVGGYLVMAIAAGGLPTTTQGVTALLIGAVPIAQAAVRTWLNKTPLTPDVLPSAPPAVGP